MIQHKDACIKFTLTHLYIVLYTHQKIVFTFVAELNTHVDTNVRKLSAIKMTCFEMIVESSVSLFTGDSK